MFKKELKKTSLTLEKNDYQLFKEICKVNNSDASKELRKFIAEYIKDNQQIVMKLKTV